MTITLPLRRMTLHLSQIFLTLGLTFMIVLFLAVLERPDADARYFSTGTDEPGLTCSGR